MSRLPAPLRLAPVLLPLLAGCAMVSPQQYQSAEVLEGGHVRLGYGTSKAVDFDVPGLLGTDGDLLDDAESAVALDSSKSLGSVTVQDYFLGVGVGHGLELQGMCSGFVNANMRLALKARLPAPDGMGFAIAPAWSHLFSLQEDSSSFFDFPNYDLDGVEIPLFATWGEGWARFSLIPSMGVYWLRSRDPDHPLHRTIRRASLGANFELRWHVFRLVPELHVVGANAGHGWYGNVYPGLGGGLSF